MLIGQETVAGMDPYYREVVPWAWRERRADPRLQPTEAATAIYSPIGWGEAAVPLVPPLPDPTLDDPALLGSEYEASFAPDFDLSEPIEEERAEDIPAAPVFTERKNERYPSLDFPPPQEWKRGPEEVEAIPTGITSERWDHLKPS